MRFLSGLSRYLAAIVAFLWIGVLTGGADPGDALAAGLAAAFCPCDAIIDRVTG